MSEFMDEWLVVRRYRVMRVVFWSIIAVLALFGAYVNDSLPTMFVAVFAALRALYLSDDC